MSDSARKLLPTLAILVLSLVAAAPASAANWTCEGSALRGSVLDAPAIEPLTANRGGSECVATRAETPSPSLPLPVDVTSLLAETTVLNADQLVPRHQVGAVGAITDLRVRSLPELPIQIPLPSLDGLPLSVTLPAGLGTVDLTPAVAALLPDGRLPVADILRVRTAAAYAGGQCVDGKPQLLGSSRVAGISVLGQELPVNEVVERTVSLVDSQTIDPSNANLAGVALPPLVTLDTVIPLVGTVEDVLQQALDALPELSVPAALATVKVTPGAQTIEGGRLIQHALRVQVGVLGRSLTDLLLGEASVGERDIACTDAQSAAETALQCTTRRLVLADVIPAGRRVRLLGFADRQYIGRTVDIVFGPDARRVARTVIRDDGSFSTTAPMPSRRVRNTDLARYQAQLGKERSLRLKLMRRMRVLGVRASGRSVTISGQVVKPLARPVATIEVRRRVSCSRWEVVKRIQPSRTGRFRTTLAGPPSQLAATYRFATRVRASARGKSNKTFETFTLPRFVDLG